MRTMSLILSTLLLTLNLCRAQVNINPGAIGRLLLKATDSTSIGTAFVAGESRSIYTCSHVVVEDTMWFNCIASPRMVYRVTVKYNLPSYDVAFLVRTGGSQPASLPFGDFSRVQPGDTVFYVGWDARAQQYILWRAAVSAKGSVLIEQGTKVDFIEFSGEAVPGYSGGPVLDRSGKVVAMIREGWQRTSLRGGAVERVNRAFSVELLRVLGSELKTHSQLESGKTPKKLIDLRQ
jgi:S1-C subfamily serine protease